MSHFIPVFSFAADPAQIPAELHPDPVLKLCPDLPWTATSRNWWFQGLLEEALAAYPGFAELDYLVREVAVVQAEQAAHRAEQIRCFLQQIRNHPAAFCALSFVDETQENLPSRVQEAVVLRALDDDSQQAFGNFFSFLASQAAALDEAARDGKALCYVQPRP